jgi:hypothetical protein
MSSTVCLVAGTIGYPQGGGHLWVHLNWALGLRALGCRVIWLERVEQGCPAHEVQKSVAALKSRLGRYGLAECVALCLSTGEPLPRGAAEGCLDLDAAAEADLLLSLRYDMPTKVVRRFRRSAVVDIDPGVLQINMSKGWLNIVPHDVYFTIGETVGTKEARFPDCGLRWHYTPPPVFLPAWPSVRMDRNAPYTTVSHWGYGYMEFDGEIFDTGKRAAFFDYSELPSRTSTQLELALCLGGNTWERRFLEGRGWSIREAWDVSSTPEQYRAYIQHSRGEFSCAKSVYVRFRTAWISDRTVCYLASGKPVVAQHTGRSRFLPDSAGLFRFRNMEEAAHCLETVEADYERQCRLARALAEEHFDAKKVIGRVLERALA